MSRPKACDGSPPSDQMKAFCLALIGVAAAVVGAATQSAATTSASWRSAGARQQPAGQPPVTFAVDVSLVEVDAVVTDSNGRVMRGLSREDFRIVEDGKPQAIDRMSFVEIPIGRADVPS